MFFRTKPASKPVPGLLSSVIGAVPEPVVVLGEGARVKSANRAFLRLLSYREEEVLEKPVELFFRDKDLFSLEIEVKLLARGWVEDFETSFVSKEGEKIPVSFSASTLAIDGKTLFIAVVKDLSREKAALEEFRRTREELGRRISSLEEFRSGVFQMLRDLDESESELKDACDKLKSTQAQLIQSSKLTALGELAAGLAHELNQPLTVIMGLTKNTIKQMEPGTNGHEKLKLIFEAARKMELIIKHLRVFSRIDEKEFSPIDINSVIKDAFLMLMELLHRSSIEVRMNLNPVPGVYGSAVRLEQVVINLVANAKDAMAGGGVLDVSTGTAGERGELVAIKVSDTGKGIPEEFLPKIFDPFFTTKEPGKGTGLGLSISYGIVKEHGGDITVETGAKGTTFTVTLPARPEKTPGLSEKPPFKLSAKIQP